MYKNTVGKRAGEKRDTERNSVSGKGIFYVQEVQKAGRCWVVFLHHGMMKECHKVC